jgi:hypothetical protein
MGRELGMASESVKTLKIPGDIEYRVIGNAFGLLISMAGLLGGTMLNQRSFEYWMDDLVPLLFSAYMSFRLFRNFLATLTLYQDAPPLHRPAVKRIQADQTAYPQLPSAPSYTAEQVVEEVAKRIEAQKLEAQKKNKMIN